MKKIAQYIPFLILSTLFISSCTDTVDLDLDDAEKILVVEGAMTNLDTTHWVKLSYTQNVFQNSEVDYTIESGALVTLYENELLIDTMEFNLIENRFETEYIGVVGNTYGIRIVTEDGTRYFSETEELVQPVPIDTIWSTYEKGNGFEEDSYKIYIETHEPAGKGDNYQWKKYVNGFFQDDPEEMLMAPDDLVDGNQINDWDIYFMEDEDFDAFLTTSTTQNVVHVRIEQASISKNYREYLQIIFEQTTRSGSLFSPPPAEIRGNIRKDVDGLVRAQGYFYTAGIHDISVDVPKQH